MQAPQDTTSVFRAAARAESSYEASLRRHAPLAFGSSGGDCDETIGRYCVYYDTGRDTLPTEPAEIRVARDSAIAALARASDLVPGRDRFVYPLARLLVEAGRPTEAVAVARAYARARGDVSETHMLLGFALHADRQTAAALEAFERWTEALTPRQRDRLTDVRWFHTWDAERRYQRLDAVARRAYEERAWRFADPLYLTSGNELLADHLARHALAHMLDERGHLNGTSWGSDLEQLTIRFGLPVRTTRSTRPGMIGDSDQLSEHWDPSQRTYFAPDLSRVLAAPARLDSIWPIDTLTSRSGHSPPTIRLMRVLEGQIVAFPDQVRFFGVARADTLVRDALGALFLLDSAFHVVGQAQMDVRLLEDSVVVSGSVPLRGHPGFYSAEFYDPVSRLAARARYALQLPAAAADLQLSGLLLAEGFDPGRLPEDRQSPLLRPLTRPVVGSGSLVGIYAELWTNAERHATAQVELELEGLSRGSALGRAVGWLGRALGISQPRAPARLGWRVELDPEKPTALPVTLDLRPLKPGVYRITLTVRGADGTTVTATRDFVIT